MMSRNTISASIKILFMDLQQADHQVRIILPGEIIQANNAKYPTDNFYISKQGQLKSLYCGVFIQKTINQSSTINIIKANSTYFPQKNDLVIGVIKMKTSQHFIVDINAPLDSYLGDLEFDGATKRNKPNLLVGSLVYCRVSQYSKFIGGRLSCINKGFTNNNKKNELGELKDGMIIRSIRERHKLVESKLEEIGKHCKFEIAFGKNGLIWFNSTGNLENMMVLNNIFGQLLKECHHEVYNILLAALK